MGKFFGGRRAMSERELLAQKYRDARGNLLLAIIFTVVNCAFAAFGSLRYFLFSCTFPYTMVWMGSLWTGRLYSVEEYEDLLGITEADFFPIWLLYVMIVPAVIALGVYLLCWIFSKKHVGWLIAATALFVIDTMFLILFYGVAVEMVLDYLFHAWALFLFIRGIIAHFKLKAMPPEPEQAVPEAGFVPVQVTPAQEGVAEAAETEAATEQADKQEVSIPKKPNSPVLHMADYSVKSREILAAQSHGLDICYRRVGTVNELVVNSMVYDMLDTGLIEQAHELSAVVDGFEIAVGTDAFSHMYISVDGIMVKRKLRII